MKKFLIAAALFFFLSCCAFAGQKDTLKSMDGSISSYVKIGKAGKVDIIKISYYSDGLKVKGLLYLPPVKKGEKLPVVFFNHDGVNGVSHDHETSSLRMTDKGYAVFCPSYRGEVLSYRDRGKPKDQRDKSEGTIEIALGEVNDVLNAAKMISRLKWADTDRFVFMGASHGALISLIAASKSNNLKGVILAYGVMDIYKWWDYLVASGKLGNDDITKRTYGKGPKDKPEAFSVRNGVSYAAGIKCPVLVLQGTKDDIVPPDQAQYIKAALDEHKVKNQVFIYPDACHGFIVYAPYETDADKKEKQQAEEAWREVFKFLKTVMK
ncbi:MAG: dienelactone hydrolase family protein [Firmicutes bacterium]|nr:dienelactone hydrolase family protein [Bacillota bacterium]